MAWTDNPLIKYLIEARIELKKVAWPTRKETLNYTLIVIGVCLGLAIFIGAVDFGLSRGLQFLISKKTV